jgi:hypothetical protein
MKKHFLCLWLLLVPVINWAGTDKPAPAIERHRDLFAVLNLSAKGLSNEVFQLALKGYRKLESIGRLQNKNILTIVDFSQSSKNKRFYVIDLKNEKLLFNTYVAHGRNTGDEFAKYFSNLSGSCKSSLGFYVTKNPAMGASVGLSLIIDGVEKGFNDNALKREIIMHGAAYATETFIKRTGRLGRSFGCPSLPPDLIKPVIETIEKGTCLFIYHRDDYYLHHSSLLN